MKNKFKKGITIEYVLVTMAIVASFLVLLFTNVIRSTENSSDYIDYVEKKAFIDRVSLTFLNNIDNKNVDYIMENDFKDNKYNLTWRKSNGAFMILEDHMVVLMMEFKKVDGEYVLTTYRYGLV